MDGWCCSFMSDQWNMQTFVLVPGIASQLNQVSFQAKEMRRRMRRRRREEKEEEEQEKNGRKEG